MMGCFESEATKAPEVIKESQSDSKRTHTENLILPGNRIPSIDTLNNVAQLSAIRENNSGLDFPSNGQTTADIRFRFRGASLIPMYPATYVWRVKLRQQAGYYTTFFWGPDGPFTGVAYFGCHPYPDGEPKPQSRSHKWELSIDGADLVTDIGGKSTQVGYDQWKIQALRVFDNGANKIHEFFWDLPDTTKMIRSVLPRNYGVLPPLNPALTFGDAPWSLGRERLSGILRGVQLYSISLSLVDLLMEVNVPMSSALGKSNIWYLNLNPTPADISDKSGKNHNPEWVTASRPSLWTDGTTGIIQNFGN